MKLLNRNKKTDATKPTGEGKTARRGFFGRKKKVEQKKETVKAEEKPIPEPTAPVEPIATKPEETTQETEKKEEIIPETVHSEDEDTFPSPKAQQLPATPAKDAPNGNTPTTPRDPDGERCNVPASTQKTMGEAVKAKEVTGASPVEPEGRNEEATGETPEKNRSSPRDDDDNEQPHDIIKTMSEDPPEENPGLLCGCI